MIKTILSCAEATAFIAKAVGKGVTVEGEFTVTLEKALKAKRTVKKARKVNRKVAKAKASAKTYTGKPRGRPKGSHNKPKVEAAPAQRLGIVEDPEFPGTLTAPVAPVEA